MIWRHLNCFGGISPMGNSGHFPQGKPAVTESRYPTQIYYKVHAGSFRVSIIHRTLTWTTGSVTCVRDHSYACLNTRGLGTPTASQRSIFDSEKLSHNFFLCSFLTGFEPRGLWISSPTLYQLSHPRHNPPPLPPTPVDVAHGCGAHVML